MSRSRDLGDVGSKANFLDNVSTDLGDYSGQSIPHIVPRYLHPAIEGKSYAGVDLKSLVTAGNYVWGDVYSGDNRRYFYTDIKGSRKILDARIGAHFGSQRHKFKSKQLLEQETATHGENVYSVDGRDWVRVVGPDWTEQNDTWGTGWYSPNNATTNSHFFEIVGYFSDANISGYASTTRDVSVTVDGGTPTTNTGLTASVGTPLDHRYVDAGSSINLGLNQTLGIHTLKIGNVNGDYCGVLFNVELIAQDTSNRNNIQIPSQNVVSYGKKFTVSAEGNSGHHFNPFNNQAIGNTTSHGKNTTGWTSYDSTLDTATSLGLDAWVDSGNYYRPVNGGRIVKWVDSSGNIKTSVNMMPPAGRHISGGGNNGLPTGTSWLTSYQPSFMAGAIDHSQAEVAKTFNWREFGNGNANAGPVTGSTGGSYKDFSMLYEFTATDCAFVMDDGLTSLTGDDVHIDTKDVHGDANGDGFYITFIGTGITLMNKESSAGTDHLVQNLPYGSHIVKYYRSSGADPTLVVDGVTITCATGTYTSLNEITFYQPKKPPIPEEAVVLCDYMLMADFVSADTSHDNGRICKGVRRNNSTRDHFYDTSASFTSNVTLSLQYGQEFGFWARQTGGATGSVKLPFFGTRFICVLDSQHQSNTLTIDGGSDTYNSGTIKLDNATTTNLDGVISPTQTLGIHNFTLTQPSGGYTYAGTDIATPTHSSSHYQSFESPFLYELIGGDRNMEQTNLICTPDGRTWDQISRNTSYLGPKYSLTCSVPNGGSSSGASASTGSSGKLNSIFTDYRGKIDNVNMHNKGIALAYDCFIPLYDGYYEISVSMRGLSGNQLMIRVSVNDNDMKDHYAYNNNGDYGGLNFSDTYYMKRGERWDVSIVSGTFRIQFRASTLFQVKYLGTGR